MKINLACHWRNKTSHGQLRAIVETSVPMRDLHACPRVAGRLEGRPTALSNSADQSGCLDQLTVGIRTIWFMQQTGFRHSKARTITRVYQRAVQGGGFYAEDNRIQGIDHPSYWRTPDGVLVMSNEPYYPTYDRGPWEPLEQVRLPKPHGMWYPPMTTLFLLAKPEHSHVIELARDQLIAAGSAPMPAVEVFERAIPAHAPPALAG